MTEDEFFKSRAATACRRSCERRGMTPCVDSEGWKPCQGCEREAVFIELNSGVPREEHERRVAELLEANNRYQEEAREARRRDQMNTASMSIALAAAASKMLVVGEELTKRKNRISELETEVLEHQQLFDLRWKAHMRAIERWRAGNPGNELVQPDLANLDVWLLDQLDEAQGKVDGLTADLDSVLACLIRRINGEADLASAAEWVRLNYPNLAEKIRPQIAEIVLPSSGDVFADLGVERPGDLPPAVTGQTEIPADTTAADLGANDDPGPHSYSPSAMHMGDCSVCGNLADHPNHVAPVSIAFRAEGLPLAGDDGDHSDA